MIDVKVKLTKVDSHGYWKEVDVLVAGGGPAGIGATLGAARQGVKTLLIERYGRLGGATTINLVQPFMGRAENCIAEEIFEYLQNHKMDYNVLDVLYADLLIESGASILLHSWVLDAITENNCVKGVRILTKQGILPIGARVIVDATGDGDVAFAAGSAFEKGRTTDRLMQPMSIVFLVGGVDKSHALLCENEEQALEVRIPEGSWQEIVMRGCISGELPKEVGVIRVYETEHEGERIINATQINNVDGTIVEDLTRAELEGRRQAVRIMGFLRKHAPGYEGSFISKMPMAVGVRETRRFLGVDYLEKADLLEGRKWDTAVVRDAKFSIDIHNPSGAGQADGFSMKVQPYDIPYGCLVPRETNGLLMAGRCISGSHEAMSSYRVQKIAMATGGAAGVAAALACRHGVEPRHVNIRELQTLLQIER